MSNSQAKGFLSAIRGSLRPNGLVDAARHPDAVAKSPFDAHEPDRVSIARSGTVHHNDASYYQKLTTLFPAEALAIYGTGTAIFGGANFAVVGVGLVVLIGLRTLANQRRDNCAIDWKAVLVAVASYLLWATANDPNWLTGLIDMATLAKPLRQYAALFGAALVVLAPVLAPSRSS